MCINFGRRSLFFIAVMLTLACGADPNLIKSLRSAVELSPQSVPPASRYSVALGSVGDGLDNLSSYRANLIVEFEGSRSGQTASGRIESLKEVTRQPPLLHQYVQAELITPTHKIANGISDYYRLGDHIYAKKAGAEDWLSLSNATTSPADLGLPVLEELIILPSAVSNPPQFEILQGLSVQHYTFTESDLNAPNLFFEQAQGDLWLATHGNFLMQYVISASVRITIPAPQADIFDRGQLNLRYALTDINQELTIAPPPETVTGPATFARLPRLADAELISVLPAMIEYTSAISSISATLFYREKLIALEWTEEQAEIFNEKSQLAFSKDGETLTILITPADDPDIIKVVLDLKHKP